MAEFFPFLFRDPTCQHPMCPLGALQLLVKQINLYTVLISAFVTGHMGTVNGELHGQTQHGY